MCMLCGCAAFRGPQLGLLRTESIPRAPPTPALVQIKLRHERLVAMSKKPVVEGEQA